MDGARKSSPPMRTASVTSTLLFLFITNYRSMFVSSSCVNSERPVLEVLAPKTRKTRRTELTFAGDFDPRICQHVTHVECCLECR